MSLFYNSLTLAAPYLCVNKHEKRKATQIHRRTDTQIFHLKI
jgi:hypothetical protein